MKTKPPQTGQIKPYIRADRSPLQDKPKTARSPRVRYYLSSFDTRYFCDTIGASEAVRIGNIRTRLIKQISKSANMARPAAVKQVADYWSIIKRSITQTLPTGWDEKKLKELP